MRRLQGGLPVEHCGGDGLLPGHPGRVTDPSPEDVFVERVGLEDAPVSRRTCVDLPALAALDEAVLAERSDRVRRGLPPLG
ncbi:MAG TPA: hypothetical protein VNU66_05325 [Mycobacteriales bacterium]|nr:hypothetical protein [Mycobacteriales bacterium]